MRFLLLLLFAAIPAATIAQDESYTVCIVGLSGYAAYSQNNNQFGTDEISAPVVIQISKTIGVSVMGWPNGSCDFAAGIIVCSAGDTVETYLITDDGVVYYTKTTSNPVSRGTKAMIGRIGAC